MPHVILLISIFLSGTAFANIVSISIGTNSSFDEDLDPLKYAEDDAFRFRTAMQHVGGIKRDQNILLRGPSVSVFRDSINRLIQKFSHQSNKKFIFYFSGHADERGLHFHDGYISKASLHAYLARMQANTKIAIIDSCFSGEITNKGITTGDAFELPKAVFDEPSGSVFLSASSDKQFAYESELLKSSLFSHHLIAGLYGEADSNQDGLVTVDEAYLYVYRNTRLESMNYPKAQMQDPEFVSELKGQGAVVLSQPAAADSALELSKDIEGELNIASSQGLLFFRFHKPAGKKRQIKLPSGQYEISISNMNGVSRIQKTLKPTLIASLGVPKFKARAGIRNQAKGATQPLQSRLGRDSIDVFYSHHSGYNKVSRTRFDKGARFEVGYSAWQLNLNNLRVYSKYNLAYQKIKYRVNSESVYDWEMQTINYQLGLEGDFIPNRYSLATRVGLGATRHFQSHNEAYSFSGNLMLTLEVNHHFSKDLLASIAYDKEFVDELVSEGIVKFGLRMVRL